MSTTQSNTSFSFHLDAYRDIVLSYYFFRFADFAYPVGNVYFLQGVKHPGSQKSTKHTDFCACGVGSVPMRSW